MDGPKFGRAGARKQAARIGGWRPKNWKSGDQSRCRERPEFGNDPELEQCGPKIGKARQPAASGGSRRLENQYLSIISIVLKTACPSTPRSAAPGCLFCRRPPTCRPTGCPAGRRRLCRLLCRPLLPVGLSGVPPRRRRPAVPLVAPPVAAASAGCCAGRSFPPAIPIDPPVSPFAGPPRRTGGVCLPFGRNGGRKCRSRLEYCAEFPSFVTPKHQYHEKPPPRTLCVCGLLQCSAGRMLRA